jgi:hypothetical protein
MKWLILIPHTLSVSEQMYTYNSERVLIVSQQNEDGSKYENVHL